LIPTVRYYYTMRQDQQSNTVQADNWSVARRVFGVGFRRETYANLAYFLVRFPLGIAYFTVLITGLSLGIGLIPLLIGIPILAGVLAIGGYIGVVEAELLRRFRGDNITVEPASPRELSVTDYLKTVATTPRNYVLVVFGLASFVVGTPLFVSVIVVFSLGVALIATPLTYWIPGVEYRITDSGSTIETDSLPIQAGVDVGSVAGGSINTLPEALVASVAGVVICLMGLHAVNLSAWLLSGVTERIVMSQSE
jgi:hypothetical protein